MSNIKMTPARGCEIIISDCQFDGFNDDGSSPFTFIKDEEGNIRLLKINMVGWVCKGPKISQDEK